MAPEPDRALSAFRRLLADAADGGQSKVDALVALSQRTLLVPTWTVGGDDYRPLVSSDGHNALPVFTGKDILDDAARRFGWMQPDGTVAYKEVGSRAAFRHALAHQLAFVVIDIVASHTLEVERGEIQPLLESRNRSDSSGAFAGVGRISEMMLQQVRPSSVPAAPPSTAPASFSEAPLVPSAPPSPSRPPLSALGGTPQTVQIHGGSSASELLLDSATEVLRKYPEVEWACHVIASRGGDPVPMFGLRIDQTFRARLPELREALLNASKKCGGSVDILLLDDMALMKNARQEGEVFFPWRKRK